MPTVADLALLSDCQGAAIVDGRGTLLWWCASRFDDRPSFSGLLDPGAGHFSLAPVAPAQTGRRYREDTLVLETAHRTPAGAVRVHDALALAPGSRGHKIGHGVPHALVRVVEGLAGEVEVEVDFAPRPDWGLVRPELARTPGGVRTLGGPGTLHLRTDVPLRLGQRGRATGRFTVRAGDRVAFVMRHAPGWEGAEGPELPPADTLLEETAEGWRSWVAAHGPFEGEHAALVRRSALVLQGLTYAPTGAMVAAATSSLPEVPGGPANWDYRFAWLRDGSFTVRALRAATCGDETIRYLEWMGRAAASCAPGELPQVVFGVEGERDLSEHELPHLAGFGGARPVRVGNDAWRQLQLDVPGEVLDAAWQLRDGLDGQFEPRLASFLAELADTVAARWPDDDAGIWEGREGLRPYTPSKVMAWTALDRAVRLADRLGEAEGAARVRGWAAARDEVRALVLERAWHDGIGAYTGALGSDHLDAAVLMMPLVGFLPATDPRMRRTIEVVARELGDGSRVRRWTGSEDEQGFALCSFWLAECLVLAGEVERAAELFEAAAGHANDLGLLGECLDEHGTHGNFPQAFSHVGLINAAVAIDRALTGARA